MITRFGRYPGGKILGFGATHKIQNRHYYSDTDILICAGLWAGIFASPFGATYLAYKAYKYFHSNYEIVKKNKMDDKADMNGKNISENQQSVRRPGRMGSSS